jgi:hypothetical protein
MAIINPKAPTAVARVGLETQKPIGKKQVGTGFQNVRNLIGASSGAKMGQNIATGVGAAATGAKSAVQEAGQQTLGKQEGARAGEGQLGTQYQNIMSGTGALTSSAEDLSKKLKTGFTGPSSLVGEADVENRVNTAQTYGRLGSGDLLGRFVAKGPYTGGQSALDRLILGQNQEQMKKIQTAKNQAMLSGQDLNVQRKLAETRAQSYTGEAKDFRDKVTKETQEAQTGLRKEILDDRLVNERARIDNEITAIRTRIAEGTSTPDDYLKLEPLLKQYESNLLMPGDVTKEKLAASLQSTSGDLTKENVMNQEDLNRLAKYSALSGITGKETFGDIDTEKVGKKMDEARLSDTFKDSINSQETTFRNELKTLPGFENISNKESSAELLPKIIQHYYDTLRLRREAAAGTGGDYDFDTASANWRTMVQKDNEAIQMRNVLAKYGLDIKNDVYLKPNEQEITFKTIRDLLQPNRDKVT